MTTQHTPAPWTLDPCASGWMLISNGQDITAEPFDARDADARLIASAPDLLIALRDLLEDAVALGICESNMSGSAVAARAAIARATGGAA